MRRPVTFQSWRTAFQLPVLATVHTRSFGYSTDPGLVSPLGQAPAWTGDDEKLLMSMKAERKPTADILAAFPGRSSSAIAVKWSKITPRSRNGRPVYAASESVFFTDDDNQKMRELREAGLSFPQIQRELFPSRTPSSVKKAYYNALSLDGKIYRMHARWSKEEVQKMLHLRLSQKLDIASVAAILGRTYHSVADKSKQLTPAGVLKRAKKAKRVNTFTPEQDRALQGMWQAGQSTAAIASSFPSFPPKRVFNRIAYLREKGEVEIAFRRRPKGLQTELGKKVQQLASKGMGWKELAAQLPGVPRRTLQEYFYKLDPDHRSPVGTHRPFTAEEEQLVLRMAGERASLVSMAAALGHRCSPGTIKNRLLKLGLYEQWRGGADRLYKIFTPETDAIIVRMSKDGATRQQILDALDNQYSLYQLRRRIGVLEIRENFKAKPPLSRTAADKTRGSDGQDEDAEGGWKLKAGTPEADEQTMSMNHSGKSNRQICAVVDYQSPKALQQRLHELGKMWNVETDRRKKPKDPPFTPHDDDLISEMYKAGANLAAINVALRWKFSFQKFRSRLKYLWRTRGIKRSNQNGRKKRVLGTSAITERDENLIRLRREGATDVEIMHALGVPSKWLLTQWYKDLTQRKGVQFERRIGSGMAKPRIRRARAAGQYTYKPKVIFSAEEDEKLIQLDKDGATYEQMAEALDSKYNRYRLRQRRIQLGLEEATSRGKRKRGRATVSEESKKKLLELRQQGLSWQEMALQVPEVAVEVVQDFYFYGEQVIKLIPTMRTKAEDAQNLDSTEEALPGSGYEVPEEQDVAGEHDRTGDKHEAEEQEEEEEEEEEEEVAEDELD